MEQSEPFIVVTSKPGTETSQIFVCCERQIYLESKSMRDALLDMMATYFVFNIAYPKGLHGILIFLQHNVFNLLVQQTVPSVVKTLVGNLLKLWVLTAHIEWLLENEWLPGMKLWLLYCWLFILSVLYVCLYCMFFHLFAFVVVILFISLVVSCLCNIKFTMNENSKFIQRKVWCKHVS